LYTYYYQLAVNFEWGGGGGAPAYYVSSARSGITGGVYTAYSPTPVLTQTETPVFSATHTKTETSTETDTVTRTPTATDTATNTNTETVTFTCTPTLTLTATATFTATTTSTASPTASATVTPTATSALAVNLAAEKFVILNSPISHGMLELGVYSGKTGRIIIYIYGISGELALKKEFALSAGANVINCDFKKARGLYILRGVIKDEDGTHKLPLRKFGVTKNMY
jgi:hypothetical protein